jgi:hypothetical protein
MKRSETEQNEMKHNEIYRNEMKRNEIYTATNENSSFLILIANENVY